MESSPKTLVEVGTVSYLVAFLFAVVAFVLGIYASKTLLHGSLSSLKTPPLNVAIADRQGIIYRYGLSRTNYSREEFEQVLATPIKTVLQSYTSRGYIVIDAVNDPEGGYSVSALPDQYVDITSELQRAVDLALKRKEGSP